MNKRTALYALGLIILALALLARVRSSATVYAKPEKITGLPQIHYEVPPIVVEPGGSRPNNFFDWMGAADCHCDGLTRFDPLIIDSIKLAPRTQPGYQYVAPLVIDLPDYLKGSVDNLGRNPPLPSPIVYEAARPSFWWGWSGLSRVIYTSDGFTLRTGSSNKLWTDVTPGRNALSVITRIRYNAQEYQLDASRSVGL